MTQESRADAFNLQKHPELFYLGNEEFHICTECLRLWECETIQNYGSHDHSEQVEKCYECLEITYSKAKYVNPNLPKWIIKKLIIAHLERKALARSRGAVTE